MAKPKIRVLTVDRPLIPGEHPVITIFNVYNKDYDMVIFPPEEGSDFIEIILLNTGLMEACQWAALFGVENKCREEDVFYDLGLLNIDEEDVCDILDQTFEVVTADLTAIEKNYKI